MFHLSIPIIVVGVTGIVCTGFVGLGFFLGFSQFIEDFIALEVGKASMLEKGTEQYERWQDIPVPMEFKVYVFNVTNSDDVVNHGAKPIVQEVGPFVYHEHFHKESIKYSEDDDTLHYNQYARMKFIREKSIADESCNVTIINLPLQGVFQNEEEGDLPREVEQVGINLLWSQAFQDDGIFVTISIKEFFFRGYEFCVETQKDDSDKSVLNKLLNMASKFAVKMFCQQVKDVAETNPTLVITKEKIRFSMFSHKDNHSDGRYQISAGKENVRTLGNIISWNDKSYLDIWGGGENSICNRLHGTDSAIYPPFNNMSTQFVIFNSDICRMVMLTAVEEVVYKGIPGVKARMGPENMRNDGEYSCYCINKTRNLKGELDCFPAGFCDMHNCLKAPIVISLPHMLWADESYRSTVEGLSPDEEKHASSLVIEPTTGTPLQGRKRMQFNIVLRNIENVIATENISSAILPFLWVDECFDLPDVLVRKVEDEYINKMFMLDWTVYFLIGSGLAGAMGAAGFILYPRF